MGVEPGTIVVLNGAAGAGKTTTARALQAAMPQPFLMAGIDQFLGMLPDQYLEPPLWSDVLGQFDRPGPVGRRLVEAMHRAIAELSRSGWSVVADHVMVERGWLGDAARRFAGLPAYLVGVHCPLEVLVRRERERADRTATVGEAALQFPIVHTHAAYDLELDTSRLTPDECAAAVRRHIETAAPVAFPAMAAA